MKIETTVNKNILSNTHFRVEKSWYPSGSTYIELHSNKETGLIGRAGSVTFKEEEVTELIQMLTLALETKRDLE